MPDSHSAREGGLAAALELPPAVLAAWTNAVPPVAPGQLWRAHWEEVSRFVVVLRLEGVTVEVAPVSLDVELATDDAVLLEPGETDFDVPVAIWLGLRAAVPVRVLEQHAGAVHLDVDALRKAPAGRPVLTPLDDRAMGLAVLGDDMDELAAAPTSEASLPDLLHGVTIKQLAELRIPTPHALALLRGLRPLTPEQAADVASLTRASPEALLRANPPLPAEVLRDLAAAGVQDLLPQLAARRGISEEDARLMAGYGAYALSARETGPGTVDWSARIVAYVRALLGDE
jgi:hypothetical protein